MKHSAGLVVGLGLMLATSGCLMGGERAQQNSSLWGDGGGGSGEGGSGGEDSSCIDGEVCSNKTPKGLYFSAPQIFDAFTQSGAPRPIVAGGTEKISIYEDMWGNSPFTLPFDAAGTGVMTPKDIADNRVEVAASGPGTGYLRLLEPGTDLLYDRLLLEAREATELSIGPYEAFPFIGVEVPSEPWAILASSEVLIGAAIYGGEDRLVDQSAILSVSGDIDAIDDLSSWDSRRVTAAGSGEITFTVELPSAGKQASTTFPIVSAADDIVVVPMEIWDSTDVTLSVGETAYYCFRAMSGKNPIAGVDYLIEPSPGLAMSSILWWGCVEVEAEKPGLASLTVTAAGVTKQMLMQVVTSAKSSGAPVSPPEVPSVDELAPGERSAY